MSGKLSRELRMKKKMLHELICMTAQYVSRKLDIVLQDSQGNIIKLYVTGWDSDEEIVASYKKNVSGLLVASGYYTSDDSETETDFASNVCDEFHLDRGSKDWGISDRTLKDLRRRIDQLIDIENLFKLYRKE